MGVRNYEATHPWIKFEFNANDFSYRDWILLGSAQSKCKHLSRVALHPESQEQLLKIYMQKGVQATTAIEGNTLTDEEILKIIDGKSAGVPKSKEYQEQEVKNVLRLYEDIDTSLEISPARIKNDNKTILGVGKGGEFRTHSVVVGNYRGAPAVDCEYLIDALCDWLNNDWGFEHGDKIIETILKAVLAHLYIAWIHPFSDGNGRTARALELRILTKGNVPAIAAHLLSNFYNETRSEYYERLSEASGSRTGKPAAFISYALQGFVDGLDAQIGTILNEQLNVMWTNFIYSKFSEKSSRSDIRKRELLLDISKNTSQMSKDELRLRLGVPTLALYKGMSAMTFYRDIQQLVLEGFLKIEDGKISANKGQLRGL